MEHCCVVGAGLGGLNTVRALRAAGHTGRITLVGAEPHRPYDRPPMSKQLLRGEVDDTTLPADWAAWDVDMRLGTRVTGLRDGVVDTDRGEIGCDGAVLATGAEPVRLPGDGPQRTLRTIDDARALRAAMRPGLRLAIVGAGWIGAEIATAARAAGCEVVVVEAGSTPLAAALPPDVAGRTTAWWHDAGVELRLGAAVASVEDGGVQLADGGTVEADEVLTAVGVRPASRGLDGVPLREDGAVLVDEHLSAGPGRCAVGDVAAAWSPRYGRHLRVEHWDNALRAPAVAAATLLGADATYDPVPYVWSEQFGRYLQFVGQCQEGDELVWRGDPDADRAWSACWVRDGRLRALLAVARPRDAVQGRRLAERGVPVDVAALADPAVPLKRAVLDVAD